MDDMLSRNTMRQLAISREAEAAGRGHRQHAGRMVEEQ